ncbi:uncharacterized protein LOC111017193 [Momordica charantia]|uniref:Uncharacterized protein LOC111017193 n=1 Tax=Momordica charantia TaxID=3673 RepID=A0A6J1D4C8_MOMCH|nr:uncharacterized protein LOC111017193 [Momordica charantia]
MAANTSANAPSMMGSTIVKSHAEKLEKFKGENFKRWQQKMIFYPTTLNLAHILKEVCPTTPLEAITLETEAVKQACLHSNFLCCNYILSCLDDTLHNVYCNAFDTSRQLWEALDKKYKLEDAGTKKFLVRKFLDYKLIDTKLVINQLEELQIITSDLQSEELVINEPFQIVAVIEKLPPAWREFKYYLKHKRKELSMENLTVKLRIEEDNRKEDKEPQKFEAKAHIVEASRRHPKKNQSKTKNFGPRNDANKRIRAICWVCGKSGHIAANGRHKKGQSSNNQANNMEDDNLISAISEVNMASDTKGWWIDTDATKHVCGDKSLFTTYEKLDDSDKLYMGNASTASVEGRGKVLLKLTSRNILTLTDV